MLIVHPSCIEIIWPGMQRKSHHGEHGLVLLKETVSCVKPGSLKRVLVFHYFNAFLVFINSRSDYSSLKMGTIALVATMAQGLAGSLLCSDSESIT